MTTRVQFPKEAVCISHCTNIPWKCMNPIILPLVKGIDKSSLDSLTLV